MRDKYYKTIQTRFPKATLSKCGFTVQKIVHVEFATPKRKRGNFLTAKSKAIQCYAKRIIKNTNDCLIYVTDSGIYEALWLEGANPTDKYGDYYYFYNVN